MASQKSKLSSARRRKRRGSKSRKLNKKGGAPIDVVPFGILALQKLLTRRQKPKKQKKQKKN